jgi:hypothetical protein
MKTKNILRGVAMAFVLQLGMLAVSAQTHPTAPSASAGRTSLSVQFRLATLFPARAMKTNSNPRKQKYE